MRYISTRGEAPALGFRDVVTTGLARDGGLYVPQSWPRISPAAIAALSGKPYWKVAETVISPFLGNEIDDHALRTMLQGAYDGFRHPAVTPLVQIHDGIFVQELFHGPTLAFKDVAMQFLGRLMNHVLEERGARATIVGATSGDTGSAAIEAFRGLERTDMFILFPNGRVSDVQRRQMTTVDAPNVHAIAIDGTFDDCQNLLKAMFNHHAFRDEVSLSGVNSINWARILAQIVYYFHAAVALGAPHRKVSFVVPTGNFGDIFAGYVAGRMGLPIERLTIATNANDILARALETGVYEGHPVISTTSPSMDIQISSNFERLLFEASGRDSAAIRKMMGSYAQCGRYEIDDQTLDRIREDFDAGRAVEKEVNHTIARVREKSGYLLDPHTAVAVATLRNANRDLSVPTVVLSTAHPAKFPDAVEAACGVRPALPPHLADLHERPERCTLLPNDLATVEAFVREHRRLALGEPA